MFHYVVNESVGCTRGAALLLVIVIMLAVTLSSGSFIWFMNQQQTRAGSRYRSAAAVAAAEAGVHRALAILETVTPDGRSPGRMWRPSAHIETSRTGALEGQFTVSIADERDGAVLITSAGQVSGVTRRLRARVYLASPVLLAALHGVSIVRFEQPPAAAFILPYGSGLGDRPWVHIAAAHGIWFGTREVSINDPDIRPQMLPGPVDGPTGLNEPAPLPPGPVRLLLASGAELLVGLERRRFDLEQLRAMGIHVEGVVLRTETFPSPPEVDRTLYREMAASNASNAALHKAAGEFLGDVALARKRDSVYTPAEFGQLLTYFRTGLRQRLLFGVIYISGGLALTNEERIDIQGGALVTEGTVVLRGGAALEITHSASTRSLPGLIVLDGGALVITQGARLRAHGLVYVSRVIDLGPGARADIVGAALSTDRGLSFRNVGATAVIRYDPAILGTPGLRAAADSPVVAWVAAWEELP